LNRYGRDRASRTAGVRLSATPDPYWSFNRDSLDTDCVCFVRTGEGAQVAYTYHQSLLARAMFVSAVSVRPSTPLTTLSLAHALARDVRLLTDTRVGGAPLQHAGISRFLGRALRGSKLPPFLREDGTALQHWLDAARKGAKLCQALAVLLAPGQQSAQQRSSALQKQVQSALTAIARATRIAEAIDLLKGGDEDQRRFVSLLRMAQARSQRAVGDATQLVDQARAVSPQVCLFPHRSPM
jgi:hypothetical protein